MRADHRPMGNGQRLCPELSERGIALPIVLLAVAVLGVLTIISLQVSQLEQSAGGGSLNTTKAFYTAEAGLHSVIASWDSARYDTMTALAGAGDSVSLGKQLIPENGQVYHPMIYHLGDSASKHYRITSQAWDPAASQWGRRVAVTVGASSALPNAAVTARSNIDLVTDAASLIDGNDTNPAGWTCDSTGPAVPAVMVAPGTAVTQGSGTLLGNPTIKVDSTIDDSRFTQIGDYTYAELVAMADKHYPGGITGPSFAPVDSLGVCDTSVLDNWGDPLNPGSPCSDYFPIIHFAGDVQFLTSGGSAGQGILLVDGELDVNPGGGFAFYGLIVTQGPCQVEQGTSVYGAVLCSNPLGQTQQIHLTSSVRYSRCALRKAMGIDQEGVSVVKGSWKDLTGASIATPTTTVDIAPSTGWVP